MERWATSATATPSPRGDAKLLRDGEGRFVVSGLGIHHPGSAQQPWQIGCYVGNRTQASTLEFLRAGFPVDLPCVGTRGTRKKRKKLMHDQIGRKLEVDDIVLIPAVVTKLYDDEDYCNVELKTLFGRRPDDAYEKFGAMNTAVVLRCNDVVDLLGLGWTS
jgi:hypothetical protein